MTTSLLLPFIVRFLSTPLMPLSQGDFKRLQVSRKSRGFKLYVSCHQDAVWCLFSILASRLLQSPGSKSLPDWRDQHAPWNHRMNKQWLLCLWPCCVSASNWLMCSRCWHLTARKTLRCNSDPWAFFVAPLWDPCQFNIAPPTPHPEMSTEYHYSNTAQTWRCSNGKCTLFCLLLL